MLARRPDLGCMADWTPLTGWDGVQIGVIWRIGRLLRAGAASRFLVVADLDACWVSARRPDLGCMADWTPVGYWRGVQIWVVWRIGRQWVVGVASRFEM